MNNGPQLLMIEPVGFKATTSVPAVPNSICYAYHPTILTDSSGILEMLCWEASTNEVLLDPRKEVLCFTTVAVTQLAQAGSK